MEELNLLEKLERVKAPSDYEQRILAQLSLRKRKKIRVKHLRFSLSGAFSAALVVFVVLNVFVLSKKSPVEFTDLEKGFSRAFQREETLRRGATIPIIEAVDYIGEMNIHSSEPRTIYILEQVSERVSSKIKY
jgi:hypothetical protein